MTIKLWRNDPGVDFEGSDISSGLNQGRTDDTGLEGQGDGTGSGVTPSTGEGPSIPGVGCRSAEVHRQPGSGSKYWTSGMMPLY